MHFLEWFNRYARWDVIGWLVIIAVGAYWELIGLGKNKTTFTDLVRATLPIWARVALFIVLIWHFLGQRVNFASNKVFGVF